MRGEVFLTEWMALLRSWSAAARQASGAVLISTLDAGASQLVTHIIIDAVERATPVAAKAIIVVE